MGFGIVTQEKKKASRRTGATMNVRDSRGRSITAYGRTQRAPQPVRGSLHVIARQGRPTAPGRGRTTTGNPRLSEKGSLRAGLCLVIQPATRGDSCHTEVGWDVPGRSSRMRFARLDRTDGYSIHRTGFGFVIRPYCSRLPRQEATPPRTSRASILRASPATRTFPIHSRGKHFPICAA